MRKIFIALALIIGIQINAQTGISWNTTTNIAANSYGNWHPRIVLDGDANPMVIWGRSSDQAVLFAKWNGTAFNTPLKLNPSWLKTASASWMGPDIASKGDTVYVVMKRTPEPSDTSHIFIISSLDGGLSFSAPVQVDDIADSLSRFPTVTVDDSGNPIVAFMKFNSSFLDARWAVNKSTDLGNSFLTDVKASGWSGPAAEVCDCCPGTILSSGNTSAMVYRDNLNNKRDMWAGISHDNGASYTSGFNVDNGKWLINSCPASGPDAIIIGDTLYTVYMSGGVGSYRTFLSRSSISSLSLDNAAGLTGGISGLNEQNYPRIASDGTAAAIVWTQTVNGNTQLPILFSSSMTKGLSSDYEIIDLGNVTNVDVALKNGNIYVVWEDDNSGTVRFRSGTYKPVITGSNTITPNEFKLYPNPIHDVLVISPDVSEFYSMKLFNSLGDLIHVTEGNSKLQLDTSNYPVGLYFIQLFTSQYSSTYKIIKQ